MGAGNQESQRGGGVRCNPEHKKWGEKEVPDTGQGKRLSNCYMESENPEGKRGSSFRPVPDQP